MKRTTICIIVVFAAMLAAAALFGCASDLKGEVQKAISNIPEFESVTVTETTKATPLGDAEAEDASEEFESIESKTVYKFDESGDELKTSMIGEIGDVTMQYFSEGDDAVCVTDGPVYSGTTEQFDLTHFDGFEAFFTDGVGDLNTFVDCADKISKEQQDNVTVYTLTLNPEKYIESDEILTMMAEYGDPVIEAVYTIGFDQDGRMVSLDEYVVYQQSIAERSYKLTDFDSTVIEPMPEADKTYEEMEDDIDEKLEAFDDFEDEESPSEASETEKIQ